MSLVYDIPSLFLITSLFYILRAWKLESEHPRLFKVTVDSNHQSQRLLKTGVDCKQWLQ